MALPGTRVSPLVLTLAAILIVLIVPPALFLLNVSLHETRPDGSLGAFTLRFYRELTLGAPVSLQRSAIPSSMPSARRRSRS